MGILDVPVLTEGENTNREGLHCRPGGALVSSVVWRLPLQFRSRSQSDLKLISLHARWILTVNTSPELSTLQLPTVASRCWQST